MLANSFLATYTNTDAVQRNCQLPLFLLSSQSGRTQPINNTISAQARLLHKAALILCPRSHLHSGLRDNTLWVLVILWINPRCLRFTVGFSSNSVLHYAIRQKWYMISGACGSLIMLPWQPHNIYSANRSLPCYYCVLCYCCAVRLCYCSACGMLLLHYYCAVCVSTTQSVCVLTVLVYSRWECVITVLLLHLVCIIAVLLLCSRLALLPCSWHVITALLP